ncbi:hypothetical protein K435DRAFT_650121, partial [Dendrothele bispora CBS 962.96]
MDSVIFHHLPDIECDLPPKHVLATQRPHPPPTVEDIDAYLVNDGTNEWVTSFLTDTKRLGEEFQRHKHKPTCRKKGTECRFDFPHEYVAESYFDENTNSIIIRCLDPWVNNHNPFILVCSRNNHDLKCILSGKAAKGAMLYITDYITKMDMKTGEMLSLL